MNLNVSRDYTFSTDYQGRFHIFYDLMQQRIFEVLLVSSLYDDFILEEDGRLTEELVKEFSRLNLSSPPPRITRVSTPSEAFEAIQKKDFDLIITMRRLSEMNPFEFGKRIKEKQPTLPVVLLLTNHTDTISLPPIENRNYIDEIFTWNGDSDIFLAIIKIIEDRLNVDNDTKKGKVRVIIVVEDTIQYYSIFLPIIYKEILKQTQNIMEETLNLSHRLLRRKGRPKLILAQTYEEAIELYEKYSEYLLGLITDVAFPFQGEKDYSAGTKLVKFIRSEKKYLPVLLQSSDPKNVKIAEELNCKFVHKNSINYLRDFRAFMRQRMLFGDFIFRLSNGEEVARAKNLSHFEQVISMVPSESIEFHGSHNHFSNWLYSRGEYQLASELAPYEVEEFDSIEEIRDFLLNAFENRRREKQRGVIAEFDQNSFDFTTPFTRIGNGSLGGKGRGLAFISMLLSRGNLEFGYKDVEINIPETVVIATDVYDLFIEENDLYDLAKFDIDDEDVIDRFLKAELPDKLKLNLKRIIQTTTTPLAVRSSSLLEDSQFHPLAGIYKTYMLSNMQNSDKKRLKYLMNAVKLVFASAFSKTAKSYIRSMGQKIEVEKMAVLIQKVVGKVHDKRYYPDFSGIVKSYNYYPISYMEPEDGIAEVAIGLGEYVVSGQTSLTFSPNHPNILPQASTLDAVLENSQREFLAINLEKTDIDLKEGEFSTLNTCDIEIAKQDGILDWLAAVYDYQNNRIVNSIRREGAILITFPFILQYPKFPLADILKDLLEIGKESLGYSVEIEFAVNLDYDTKKHKFYVLQIRPLVIDEWNSNSDISINNSEAIIWSEITLGNGIYQNIDHMVYIDPEKFDKTKTLQIKDEVSSINKIMTEKNEEYILVGPGRWGTKDRYLGIPVRWNDIDQARIIIESSLENFQIDPSQGMHFFVNITSTKRGYFTIPYNSPKADIKWNWITSQEVIYETEHVKVINTKEPMTVKINGKTGEGIILPYRQKETTKSIS